jgi:hypothetical protein
MLTSIITWVETLTTLVCKRMPIVTPTVKLDTLNKTITILIITGITITITTSWN